MVATYPLTAPPPLSASTALKHAKKLKQINTVQLIQDFTFPEACIKIQTTRDEEYVIGTGTYKPQVRVWETRQASMKFERHAGAENVDFTIISNDYTKIAFLNTDRGLELHTPEGCKFRTRIPKCGRTIAYNYNNCDLLTAGSSDEIWRLNLERGTFLEPYTTTSSAINALAVSEAHGLIAAAGSDATLTFIDPRAGSKSAAHDMLPFILPHIQPGAPAPELTGISFHNDGMLYAFGTSTGQCFLSDLRFPKPIITKNHQYGFPILSPIFHAGKILSADRQQVKIWDPQSNKHFTTLEPDYPINDITVSGGIIMLACDAPQIQSYYMPTLAPAPKWANHLDGIVEELTEEATSAYENFKFITREEISSLGLRHMIGTPKLKAHLHGYFMDARLYGKIRAITDPFAYERWKKERAEQKVANKMKSRIEGPKVKVNKDLAMRVGEKVFGDERFGDLFQDPAFAVDKDSRDYKMTRPVEGRAKADISEDESEEDTKDNTQDDLADHALLAGDETETSSNDFGDKSSSESEETETKTKSKPKRKKKKKISTYLTSTIPSADTGNQTFAELLAKQASTKAQADLTASAGGAMAMQFELNQKDKQREKVDRPFTADRSEKRGIKELGLRGVDSGMRGRGRGGFRGGSRGGGGGRGGSRGGSSRGRGMGGGRGGFRGGSRGRGK